MQSPSIQFTETAGKAIADKVHRNNRLNTIALNSIATAEARTQFSDEELAKQRAAAIRWKAVENLDKYLIEFEANFIRKGGKVIWVQDTEEANKEIIAILKRVRAKKVIKTRSLLSHEIGLEESLKKFNIECIETDFAEVLEKNQTEKTNFHPSLPALDKSSDEASIIFNHKFDFPFTSSLDLITEQYRTEIRKHFNTTDICITSGDFILADSGSVAISENSGDASSSIAFSKIHISLTSIENILPSINDVDSILPLLSSFSVGSRNVVYNHILSGPKQSDERDGPEEMYVILLDNGRSDVLDKPEQRQALSCIRCGACMNVCPVYQNIGNEPFVGPIGGPIGSIITPHTKGLKEFKHLSNASTLCGKCTTVCPVKIDLHKLLLENRKDAVDAGLMGNTEKGIFLFWKKGMLNRGTMNKGGATFKNFMLGNFYKKQWGNGRELPKIATKSFNELWREKHPEIDK